MVHPREPRCLVEERAVATLASLGLPDGTLDRTVGELSGGEITRLALAAALWERPDVLLLDEPTNNLDPASREQILGALRSYEGAVVLVTHDEGAVEALEPERVLLLPDAVEDLWNDDYRDLVSLA